MRAYSVTFYTRVVGPENEDDLQARITEILRSIKTETFLVTGYNVRLWTGDKREDD